MGHCLKALQILALEDCQLCTMIMVTAATWGLLNDILTACNGLTAVWCQHPVLIVMRYDAVYWLTWLSGQPV